jgi:hypothetical protein
MGRRIKVFAPVGEDYVKKAEGMVFSTEELTTGGVVVYAKRKGEAEEKEISLIAENSPGENSPTNCLQKLIDRLRREKK